MSEGRRGLVMKGWSCKLEVRRIEANIDKVLSQFQTLNLVVFLGDLARKFLRVFSCHQWSLCHFRIFQVLERSLELKKLSNLTRIKITFLKEITSI